MRNKKFGALTPLVKQGKTSYGKTIWLCQCDCGKKTKANENHLKSGNRVSCGCLIHRKQYLLTINDLCIQDKLTQYKKGAKNRKYNFKLSKEDFGQLIFNNCYYCGSKPSNVFTVKSKNRKTYESEIKYNGIDRVDNTQGYIKENCVTCCKNCNIMKMELTQEEFINHIEKIYNNFKKKCKKS